MRSIVYAACWLLVGFGVTEFAADFLEKWQVRPQEQVAYAPPDAAPRSLHVVESSPAYRPARSLAIVAVPAADAAPVRWD